MYCVFLRASSVYAFGRHGRSLVLLPWKSPIRVSFRLRGLLSVSQLLVDNVIAASFLYHFTARRQRKPPVKLVIAPDPGAYYRRTS